MRCFLHGPRFGDEKEWTSPELTRESTWEEDTGGAEKEELQAPEEWGQPSTAGRGGSWQGKSKPHPKVTFRFAELKL